jgi:N-acetylmuramoyl-L-alanine amidase
MQTAAKVAILLFVLVPALTYGQTRYLILRASHHPGFLRIVLQGDGEIVRSGRIYQRKNGILVTFPDADISLISGKVTVPYRQIDSRTVLFMPGRFRGLKVFNLNHPERLVIDVYITDRQRFVRPEVPAIEEKTGSRKLRLVMIDPGHGGFDTGITHGALMEKHVALDVARKTAALVKKAGTRSSLTRDIDIFMSMKERVRKANEESPDIFLTLHTGDHQDFVIYMPVIISDAPDRIRPYLADQGQEAYVNQSMTLVNAMEEALKTDYGEDMVRVKSLPYSMLTRIEAAAIMVELPSFESADYNDEFRKTIADSLYKGIYIYEENRSN